MSQVNLEQLIKKAMAENQSFRHCQVTKPGQIATVSIGGKTVKAICPTVVSGNAVAIKLDSPYNGIEWVVVGSNTSGQVSSQTLDDRRSSPQPKIEPVDRFDPDGFILYGKWSDEPVTNPPINNSETSWTKCPPYEIVGENGKKRIYYLQYPHGAGEYATEEDALNDRKKDERTIPENDILTPVPLDSAFYYIGNPDILRYTSYNNTDNVEGFNVSKGVQNRTPTWRTGYLERTLTGSSPLRNSILANDSMREEFRGAGIGAWGGFNWDSVEARYQELPKKGGITYNQNLFQNQHKTSTDGEYIYDVTGLQIKPLFGMLYTMGIGTPTPGDRILLFKQVFNSDLGRFECFNAATNEKLIFEPDVSIGVGRGSGISAEPSIMRIETSGFQLFYNPDTGLAQYIEIPYSQDIGQGAWGIGVFVLIRYNRNFPTSHSAIAANIQQKWMPGLAITKIWADSDFPPDPGQGGGDDDEDDPTKFEKVFLDYEGYVEHLYLKDFSGAKEIQIPLSFRAFSTQQAKDYANTILPTDSDEIVAKKTFDAIFYDELFFGGCFYFNLGYQIDKNLIPPELTFFMQEKSTIFYDYYDKRPVLAIESAETRMTRETYLAAMDSDVKYVYVYVLYGLRIDTYYIKNYKDDLNAFIAADGDSSNQDFKDYIREANSQRMIDEKNFIGCLGYNHLAGFKINKKTLVIELSEYNTYPSKLSESMKGASGYTFDAFNRYTMGAEILFSPECQRGDPDFQHLPSGSSATSAAPRVNLPVTVSNLYAISHPSFDPNGVGELFDFDTYKNVVIGGGYQKQFYLTYGFPALQKFVRTDLPPTYGALGLAPNTRNIINSYNYYIQQISDTDNHIKPKSFWTPTELSWYSLTLAPKELSYVIDPLDRLATSAFHHVFYGLQPIRDEANSSTTRRNMLYLLMLDDRARQNPSLSYLSNLFSTNGNGAGYNGDLELGKDYVSTMDGLNGTDATISYRQEWFQSTYNQSWQEWLYFNLLEPEQADVISWIISTYGFPPDTFLDVTYEPGWGSGLLFQVQKDTQFGATMISGNVQDYLWLLPFFSSHQTNRNSIITVSANDADWTDATIYFNFRSNFDNDVIRKLTGGGWFYDMPFGYGGHSSKVFLLSHCSVYTELFKDLNSNKFLNKKNLYRVPLTKTSKLSSGEMTELKSFAIIEGLGISYLGDNIYGTGANESYDGGSFGSVPIPSEYLDNQKEDMIWKAISSLAGQAKLTHLIPYWAGRLWHFMPIEKG